MKSDRGLLIAPFGLLVATAAALVVSAFAFFQYKDRELNEYRYVKHLHATMLKHYDAQGEWLSREALVDECARTSPAAMLAFHRSEPAEVLITPRGEHVELAVRFRTWPRRDHVITMRPPPRIVRPQ